MAAFAAGSGADGAITISANKNINVDHLASGRTAADGEAFAVSAIGSNTIGLTGTGTGGTAASSASSSLATGDDVLIINLRGDTTNNSNVGAYEIATVASVSGSTVTLTAAVQKTYGVGGNANITGQSIVLQRIPAYTDVTISNGITLTASAFNGSVGGIVAFEANGTVTIAGSINVNAIGYRGGAAGTTTPGSTNGGQGESYPGVGIRTNVANGGGGGGSLCPNGWAGGGGGAGYGVAGTKGFNAGSTGGPAGAAYGAANLSTVFLGSGGGGGGADNRDAAWIGYAGGNGGGIVYIDAPSVLVTGSIHANGQDGVGLVGGWGGYDGGPGGGGAGGSVLIKGDTIAIGNNLVTATAGAGGINDGAAGNGGPGAVGRIAVGYTISLGGFASPGVSVIPQPPVAVADSYKIGAGATLAVAAGGILANDTGGATAAVLDGTTTNGTLVLNADGSFSYSPKAGFVGADSFTYHATSANGASKTATVQITVFLAQVLVLQESESAGANCANGGISIASGLDSGGGIGGIAADGILQASEVSAKTYICNGATGATGMPGMPGTPGTPGMPGTPGTPGTPGANGSDGANGKNAIAATTSEPAGSNCETGGAHIQLGIDSNDDGQLGDSEITSTFYVCNGAIGATGATGAAGADGKDGINGEDGINGANGTNGFSTIVTLSDEPTGTTCIAGGKKIEAGIDLNGDATLTTDEVTSTAYVCNGIDAINGIDGINGANGKNGLAQVSPEAAGVHCKGGGQKIETGSDWDGNGKLEGEEIASTAYVCSGQDGAAASAGYNSLVAVADEAAGTHCASGGKKVQSGLDKDGSGTLETSEIQNTAYICDGKSGTDGKSGVDGKSGTDGKAGTDGKNSLVKVSTEATGSAKCASGGKRIDTGLDSNGNGVLDESEVQSTSYVCTPALVGASGGCTAATNGSTGTPVTLGLLLAGLSVLFIRRRVRGG